MAARTMWSSRTTASPSMRSTDGDLGEGLVSMCTGPAAGVVLGAHAFEDEPDLLDLRAAGLVARLRQDLAQPFGVRAGRCLERVDERQGLLASGDVRGLLAGGGCIAPDAQQVVVELEGQAQ